MEVRRPKPPEYTMGLRALKMVMDNRPSSTLVMFETLVFSLGDLPYQAVPTSANPITHKFCNKAFFNGRLPKYEYIGIHNSVFTKPKVLPDRVFKLKLRTPYTGLINDAFSMFMRLSVTVGLILVAVATEHKNGVGAAGGIAQCDARLFHRMSRCSFLPYCACKRVYKAGLAGRYILSEGGVDSHSTNHAATPCGAPFGWSNASRKPCVQVELLSVAQHEEALVLNDGGEVVVLGVLVKLHRQVGVKLLGDFSAQRTHAYVCPSPGFGYTGFARPWQRKALAQFA